MIRYYAGIGSRETPEHVLSFFTRLATGMERRGFVLRSGGAPGADTAFAAGTSLSEIYLPWPRFQGLSSTMPLPNLAAEQLASTLHPAWDSLSQGARKLMARNCFQILGADLASPVSIVLCWTPDGCESEARRSRRTGGTGQAIALASRNNIPIINFRNNGAIDRLKSFILA